MEQLPVFKILIVEDGEDDFLLLNDYIKDLNSWKIESKWVFRYEDAVQEICTGQYKICFVDYRLGAKDGIEFIKDIVKKSCSTPVILLTGKGNYEIDREATKAGAFDYLVKSDLNEEKLERCIRYTLERAATIDKLKESERRYRSIFEKSNEIVFITDMDTCIMDVNFAISEILEVDADECRGRFLDSFFVSAARKEDFLNMLSTRGEVENFEAEMSAKDGVVKTCLISSSVETGTEGNKHIQGVIHDITSIKKAELAVIQTEKLEASGRLIRTLAHEVRNPLNNINLAIENLQAGDVTEEDSGLYMDIIQRNATRIGNLITELLQSARPADMNFAQVAIKDVLDLVLESVKDRILLKKIQFTMQVLTNSSIRADIEKLAMALLNIVVNAVEAVNEETGLIEVMAHEWENKLALRIRDNGIGISKDNIKKLFEPYFTSKRNGMGLGLATTLNIIRSHEASIEVISEPGSGTEFIIMFNIHE
ncbi:hybrid sensor histidine kinase/response regulator [Sediminibacterium ginsengisoli]|uniref:histidine kinase n=1 Tax=Sediminibacterium ginsengisoli TaxID=413434 RepID=A0A1T4Q0F3_9BACT|nr:hybrid sensor histidine kinase/response regulator [Sediminibacterium ginsengisoli]SJZ97224.1 PAS domain S-box-containing protein [Sediminibacterium ginsengisoli]